MQASHLHHLSGEGASSLTCGDFIPSFHRAQVLSTLIDSHSLVIGHRSLGNVFLNEYGLLDSVMAVVYNHFKWWL